MGAAPEHKLRRRASVAIDLGGDTDTIAAVTGGLAGAVYGIHAIPTRWTQPLFVPLPGFRRTYTADDLRQLAVRLDTEPTVADAPSDPHMITYPPTPP